MPGKIISVVQRAAVSSSYLQWNEVYYFLLFHGAVVTLWWIAINRKQILFNICFKGFSFNELIELEYIFKLDVIFFTVILYNRLNIYLIMNLASDNQCLICFCYSFLCPHSFWFALCASCSVVVCSDMQFLPRGNPEIVPAALMRWPPTARAIRPAQIEDGGGQRDAHTCHCAVPALLVFWPSTETRRDVH